MTPDQPCGVAPIIQRPFGETGRFVRTVVGLRFIQFVNRYSRRLVPLRFEDAGAVAISAPVRPLAPFVEREQSLLSATRLRLLNATRDVDRAQCWDDPAWPRLWTYNLHYFDDLNAAGSTQRLDWQTAHLERWLQENPPPEGTAWEPYPASLRTVNLAKWLLRTGRCDPSALKALVMSAGAVSRQLEYHLLGNHLWANAKALYIAGICIKGRQAQRWIYRGQKILESEVGEQILADGAHFELSPMYQGTIVEDALDLVNFARAYDREPPAAIDRQLPRMLSWLEAMTHPDGEIAFFNDAAPGIAARSVQLLGYAERLGIHPAQRRVLTAAIGATIEDLTHSGYARLSSDESTRPIAVAICDASAVGPAYLPGHAHADTLSFELSLHGRRVVVNGGTSTYEDDDQRHFERSTRAHSTVELAHADSSEVWASFRCGARARISRRRAWADNEGVYLEAQHAGYSFLPGRWMHQRTWRMSATRVLIDDRIYPSAAGAARIPATVRFLLHPQVRIRALGDEGSWELFRDDRVIARFHGQSSINWCAEHTTFAEGFGILAQSVALVGRFEASGATEVHSELRFGAT